MGKGKKKEVPVKELKESQVIEGIENILQLQFQVYQQFRQLIFDSDMTCEAIGIRFSRLAKAEASNRCAKLIQTVTARPARKAQPAFGACPAVPDRSYREALEEWLRDEIKLHSEQFIRYRKFDMTDIDPVYQIGYTKGLRSTLDFCEMVLKVCERFDEVTEWDWDQLPPPTAPDQPDPELDWIDLSLALS